MLSRAHFSRTLGSLLLIMGIATFLSKTWIFNEIVDFVLKLGPNTFLMKFWKLPPITIYLNVYFFNWTNPEDIRNSSAKMKFQEMGPYVFREHRERVNLTWSDNGTVTYRFYRKWYFEENMSSGKTSDIVTTLNTVTLSAANQVKDWSMFLKTTFSLSLEALSPELHTQKTINELFFDGYQDIYIDLANIFPYLVDESPPYDKFGYMYGRNDSYTYDGSFNMNYSKESLGRLLNWNYKNETNYFEDDCAKIQGFAGDMYPQNIDKTSLNIFLPDACRNIRLDFEEETDTKGILSYKFSAQEGMLDNGTRVPENSCYCNGECLPSGVLNISSCRYGTPSFISLPHLYGADPVYLDKLEGLNPNKSKHEMQVTLEPRTGLILDGRLRIQVNALLFPMENIELFSKVPKVMVPIFWFEQIGTVPDDMLWNLRVLLSLPVIMFPILGSILIVIGLACIVLSVKNVCYVLVRKKKHLYEAVFVEMEVKKQYTLKSCVDFI